MSIYSNPFLNESQPSKPAGTTDEPPQEAVFTESQLGAMDNTPEKKTEPVAKKPGGVTSMAVMSIPVPKATEGLQVDEELNNKGVTIGPNKYLADWSRNDVSIDDISRSSGKSILEVIDDRNKWSRETGGAPLDIMAMYDAMKGRDVSKSVADNEKSDKKARNKERWEMAANFLSHLGNFVGALAGAPSQTIEPATELTKRQRMLRDKTIEQRHSDNQQLLNIWYKQQQEKRAADVAAQQQAYQQKSLELREREINEREARRFLDIDKFNWKKQMDEKNFDFKKANAQLQHEVDLGRLSQGAKNIVLRQLEYDLKAAGSTSEKSIKYTDRYGRPQERSEIVKNTPNLGGPSIGGGSTGNQGSGRSLNLGIGQTQ